MDLVNNTNDYRSVKSNYHSSDDTPKEPEEEVLEQTPPTDANIKIPTPPIDANIKIPTL